MNRRRFLTTTSAATAAIGTGLLASESLLAQDMAKSRVASITSDIVQPAAGRLVKAKVQEMIDAAVTAVTGEELVRLAAAASLYQLGTWLPLRLSVDSGKQWTFASTAQELLRGYRIREMAPLAASFVRRTLLDEAPRDRLAAGARAHLESYGKGGGAGATAEDEK